MSNVDTSDLRKQLLEASRKLAKAYVESYVDEVYKKSINIGEMAILQFYNSYIPKKGGYDRMHSFVDYAMPFKRKKRETDEILEYEVGVKFIEPGAGGHKDPDDYVYNGVIAMGIHGTSAIAVTESPLEYATKELEKLI